MIEDFMEEIREFRANKSKTKAIPISDIEELK